VDVDGHVLKLAHESDCCNHCGKSFWAGARYVNERSIGIEIVNAGDQPFSDAQYESVLRLVREIHAAYHPP